MPTPPHKGTSTKMKVPGSTVRVTDVLDNGASTLIDFFLITRFPSDPIDQRPPRSRHELSIVLALFPAVASAFVPTVSKSRPTTAAATTSLSAVVTGPDGKAFFPR